MINTVTVGIILEFRWVERGRVLCTWSLVRTVNTNSRVGTFIVRVVVRCNVAGRDTVGFARDG